MGLPVERLVVASNRNDILTRFLHSGIMATSQVVPTLSPSMDIQVSSNFERLLFELNHRDGGMTAEQLQRFRVAGTLTVEPDQFDVLGRQFLAARLDDEQTIEVMARTYRDTAMAVDPHTAVGLGAVARLAAEGVLDPVVPVVTLATAHPAKFPDAVERATGVRPPLPDHLADLLERPERTVTLPAELTAIERFVASVSRA
jgi:threonine synthase